MVKARIGIWLSIIALVSQKTNADCNPYNTACYGHILQRIELLSHCSSHTEGRARRSRHLDVLEPKTHQDSHRTDSPINDILLH